MFHYIIGMWSSAITAIQKGLKFKDRFPLNIFNPEQLRTLLAPQPITSMQLKKLVKSSLEQLENDQSMTAKFVVQLINEIGKFYNWE